MVTFRIPDMTCGHCASAIARAVAAVDKGARMEVSIGNHSVSISSLAAEEEFADAIREAGYSPEKVEAEPAHAAKAAGCCCATRKTGPVDAESAAGGSCCA